MLAVSSCAPLTPKRRGRRAIASKPSRFVERVEAEAREQDSVAYALRRVIEKLPRCRGCMEPATYDYDGDGRCDDHADPSVCVENPWADALRAIKKVAT